MEETMALLVPFLGTTLGAAMVFFMKRQMNPGLEKLLLGFASGVMIAASVWSLLLPSIEMAREQDGSAWFPAAAGFLLGMAFLLMLDRLVPMQKSAMAVTLHNLPEGMVVGVALVGALMKNTGITMAGVLVLAVGIAIQNFPEGAIISMPLRSAGTSRLKAFWYGMLSGAVEPVGALITLALAEQVVVVLPYLLAFAAGAMIYVVVEELIPESQSGEYSNLGTVGVSLGFVLMMILDVALS
ncbi:MAG: ZIP family metal transporter [Acetatifactor sp.]|nr:ZIP family metal transporter [Acetatifactor sp.]